MVDLCPYRHAPVDTEAPPCSTWAPRPPDPREDSKAVAVGRFVCLLPIQFNDREVFVSQWLLPFARVPPRRLILGQRRLLLRNQK